VRPRVAAGKRLGSGALEPEPAVETCVAKNENDFRPEPSGLRDPGLDQGRSDPVPLPFGNHGDGREPKRINRLSIRLNFHATEKHMPDDAALLEANYGDPRVAIANEPLDEVSLCVGLKRELVNPADVTCVRTNGQSQAHQTVEISGASSAFMPTTL